MTVLLAIIFTVTLSIVPHIDDYFVISRNLIGLGLVMITLLPWIFFEIFFSRKFDITAKELTIDYEFASKLYARSFWN